MSNFTTSGLKATEKAWLAGFAAGEASGSWVIDGNTDPRDAASILNDLDNCECDLMPDCLSGEWGGESIVEIGHSVGIDMTQECCEFYEDGFRQGWEKVVVADALNALPDPITVPARHDDERMQDEQAAYERTGKHHGSGYFGGHGD